MSTPYFLDGDQEYTNDAGLSPSSRDLHETRIDIEPVRQNDLGLSCKLQT